MNRIERLYYANVRKALKWQISVFTKDLSQLGMEQARSRLDMLLLNGQMAKTIKQLYVRAALPLAKSHYKLIQQNILRVTARSAGAAKALASQRPLQLKAAFGLNEKWTAEIEAFFNQYLLDKVVLPITATTKDIILKVLNEAIEKGWSVDEIVKRLNDPSITKWRARMIVRTEAVRATNYASMLAASEFDYEMEKTWIEVKDNRTRRSHRHATGVGGEVKDFYEKYSNGLMFPGDPNGSGKETINCRCTQGVKPKRDARGRLIPNDNKLPLNVALGMAA